jgi:hypothetical protein
VVSSQVIAQSAAPDNGSTAPSYGLTAAQLAAIQAAGGAAAADAPGNTASNFFGAYDSSIDASGQFDPAQEQAIAAQWNYGGNGIWNGAVPSGDINTWDSDATNAALGAATPASGSSATGLPGASSLTGLPAAGTVTGSTTTTAPTSTTSGALPSTGTAPAPLSAFGATPSVTPTYASAALVNPAYNQSYLNQQEQANAAALQPTFQAQDQSEQDQLAARGISSSGAAQDLTNQLYGQQAATLASADSSAIGQQAGYAQSDVAANQANTQAVNTGNAATANAASAANAGYYDQALTGNATTYNDYLATLESQGYNTSNEAYTAYLNSFGPNSGVTSAYTGAAGTAGGAYANAYSTSVAGEDQAASALFGAAGNAAAGGSTAGASSDPNAA